MQTSAAALAAHPTVVAAADFVRLSGIRWSAAAIHCAFAECPEAPDLGLAEMAAVFDRLGVPCAAFETTVDHLADLPFPLIASLGDEAGQEGEPARTPVVLAGVSGDCVQLLHPQFGTQVLDLEAFRSRWNGILIAADIAGARAEEDFASRHEAEARERQAYRDSIRILDHFLSPEECRALIDYCESHALFQPSRVDNQIGDYRLFASRSRTNDWAILDYASCRTAATVRDRIAAALAVDPAVLSPPQLVRYDEGQVFGAHHDGRTHPYTFLIYLSDGFAGGETRFADVDFAVNPQVGRAAVFRNVGGDGEVITWARHAGVPPIRGRKYTCNIWVGCNPAHELPESLGRREPL